MLLKHLWILREGLLTVTTDRAPMEAVWVMVPPSHCGCRETGEKTQSPSYPALER